MFRVIFLITSIFSFCTYADFNFSVNSLCNDRDLLSLNLREENISLGDLVVKLLDKNKISYTGSKYGISSINNSPISDDSLIILSDSEMLAFGWCYEINNRIPEKMPNEIILDSNVKSIRWYFGFAHYLKGEWISQCQEDRVLVKKTFCKK